MSYDDPSFNSPLKRKLKIEEKTPVAVLTELCVAEQEVPMFEDIPHETNPKMFTCIGHAFDTFGKGSGRSKKEAKHEASANIIAQLAKLDRFKNKLPAIPKIPHPTADGDAVGTMLDICVQREWPLPKFEVMESYGEPHKPVFTVLCTLSSIKCTGTFSTKKGAKQIAARKMLEIVQNFSQNEEESQVATVEAEPAEKIFSTYRELKNAGVTPRSSKIRDRHNFFLRLPEEDVNEAKKILMDDDVIYGTSKDKVHLICAALKLKYDVKDIPNHTGKYKGFCLLGNHDCVIVNKEEFLYDLVINHFKIMLNLIEIV